VLDDATLDELRGFDAILLGAIGPRSATPGSPAACWSVVYCFDFDSVWTSTSTTGPFTAWRILAQGCDFAIVRENTEGPTPAKAACCDGHGHEVATQGSVNTRFGVERCVRYAFARARPGRPTLTLVHKTNVLTFAGDLWNRVVHDVAGEFPT